MQISSSGNSAFVFAFLLIKSNHLMAKKTQTTMMEVTIIQEPLEVNALATEDLQNCIHLSHEQSDFKTTVENGYKTSLRDY